MQQKVLLVGVSARLARFEPLVRRASVEAIRLPEAEPALSLARELPVDLVVVALPPGGMAASRFAAGLRAPGSASRGAQLLILGSRPAADSPQAAGDEAFRLVPLDLDSPDAAEVVGRFLRKAPRAPARLMIRLEGTVDAVATHRVLQVHDLSRGGLLVRAADRMPLGTELAFELTLPRGETVGGKAKVVRHADPDLDRLTGMGLCFTEIEGESEGVLQRFLADRLREESGSSGSDATGGVEL